MPVSCITGDYRLVEFQVKASDWLANKTLADTKLRDEGIVVLGIKRPDGSFLGTPKGGRKISSDDTLILYGRVSALEELDSRQSDEAGEQEHTKAVEKQRTVNEKEKREMGNRLDD